MNKKKQILSVVIPTYNCAEYVSKTIISVLQQDIGEELMQIEVIDDCSSDNIEDVVKQVGGGRVKFFKQERNVGHIKNFKTAINRAEGEIIHLLHGDDFVLPGFYKEMIKMYEDFPDIKACFSRHFIVDEDSNITSISRLEKNENGILENFFQQIIQEQCIQTPSITVKKEVYLALGTFNPILTWTEDWEMWVRIAKHYSFGYIKEPLACYRVHKNSSTSNKSITGENVNDLIRLEKILILYTNSQDLKNKVVSSFRKIILNNAWQNYILSRNGHKKEALGHLKIVEKYSETFFQKIKIKLVALKFRFS